jgi:hypothetical protein
MTNFALMHALPRIAEQPADHGLFTEALMASIAQSAPEAKERVRAFLEGKAAKVTKRLSTQSAPTPASRMSRKTHGDNMIRRRMSELPPPDLRRHPRHPARRRHRRALPGGRPGSWRPCPTRLTDRLVHWAQERPNQTLFARRVKNADGSSGDWRHISFAQALDSARRIGQALLDRGLSAERPVLILSENDLEHALLALGCMVCRAFPGARPPHPTR